nr:oligopeptide/dipeptide ABC transporter ATP-binding protein [Methanotorris formicicus]
MKVSMRNQLKGTVEEIKVGQVMAEVVVKIGDQKIISVITKDALNDLGIEVGDDVFVLIKSTSVALAVPNLLTKIERLESIPGTVPNLINPPSGCRFHQRCPYVKDICKQKIPELKEIENGHFVACHLY